jgi:opacity protein-like surface antigen
MEGSTLWIDYQPNRTPYFLRGFGLEVEARDISWNRGDKPNNFRQDTASGGVIYTWQHYRKFHPYGKFMAGLASEDFRVSGFPNYTHDTRTFIAPGLGAEYRVLGHLWVRADYQYQFWQVLLTGRPDPQGFTFGVMYDFRHPNR